MARTIQRLTALSRFRSFPSPAFMLTAAVSTCASPITRGRRYCGEGDKVATGFFFFLFVQIPFNDNKVRATRVDLLSFIIRGSPGGV